MSDTLDDMIRAAIQEAEQRRQGGVVRRAWRRIFGRGYYPGPGEGGSGFTPRFPDVAPYPYRTYESFYGSNPWVFRGIKAIGDAVASLPIRLYSETRRRDGEVVRREVFDHDALRLLREPHEQISGAELIRALASNYTLSGESWLYTEDGTGGRGDVPGKPQSIRALRSQTIAPVPDPVALVSEYEYAGDAGVRARIRKHYIASAISWNPESDYRGFPPMKVASDPAVLQWYMAQHHKRFFKRGGYVGLYLSTEKQLKKETREVLEAQLKKQFEGVQSQGGMPVFDSGMEMKNVITSARDGEFMALGADSREKVLAILGVPPVMAGILDGASYANAWQQNKMFWEVTILPLLDTIEDQLTGSWLRVFWPKEKGLYFKFDTSSVKFLGDDSLTQAQVEASRVRNGILTINEVREELNRPPVDWGDDPPPAVTGAGFSFSGDDGGAIKRSAAKVDWLGEATFDQRRARQGEIERRVNEEIPLYKKLMNSYWAGQEQRILAALRKTAKDATNIQRIDADDLQAIFDADAEAKLLAKQAAPVLRKIVGRVGKQAMIDIKSDVAFNLHDPRVEEFMAQKLFKFGRDVTVTTGRGIREILLDSALNDLTVDETAARIREMYEQFNTWRALRIARTEVAGAQSGASLEGWRQDGGVAGKGWAAIIDDTTRDSHVELDGEEVGLDDNFSNGQQGPGLGADPAENVNCRCASYPVIEREGA